MASSSSLSRKQPVQIEQKNRPENGQDKSRWLSFLVPTNQLPQLAGNKRAGQREEHGDNKSP
jgi:hypothetical protein